MPISSLPDDAPLRRILVVDDDANIRSVLERILAVHHFDVVTAGSTEEALDAIRAQDFPLVLSDIHMPGRDGLSLLGELHVRYPDTAVVMLTGDADISTAVECLKRGAMDYLNKPVVVEEVWARVDKALEKRQLTLEVRRLQESYQHDLERRVHELSEKNKAMFLAQVQMAVRMLEAKDPYTRGHSTRVAEYAVAVGRVLGLGPTQLDELRLGGELHDIGKIGTRDAVLNKPGKLTPEEFEEIKRHTTDGAEMLAVLEEDHPEVLHIVRWHHERMDGTGFPDGLAGQAIPRVSRIVAVVDAFDAMTSTRAYRERQDPHWAYGELERTMGTHFDPEVVAAFKHAFPPPANGVAPSAR
jgi:putative two-component system response regulator